MAVDTSADLLAALEAAEDRLDKQNDFPCLYCGARNYDGLGGIVHVASCVISVARAAIAAHKAQQRELLSGDERADRALDTLVQMLSNMVEGSGGIRTLLRNLADPPPCEAERRPPAA